MSYRGRPSKGCESCRARKVKCDEVKPFCGRCSKSGHECKYRDQADLFFRNQTAFAAQKAEESWRKRSKSHQRAQSGSIASQQSPPSNHNSPQSNNPDSPPSESASEASVSLPNLNTLSLGHEIQPDLRRLAYERFVYDYVVFETPNRGLDEPSDALWDFIPPLYQNAAEGSCLATIVHAVCYANFSARCNAPQVQALADECHVKGFKLLQKTISDGRQAPSDDTLCAVYLMGVYEQLCTPAHNGSFLAHKEGANALLQLRTIEQFYSNSVSARLYEVSYAQMLVGNLQHGKRPSLPLTNMTALRRYMPGLHSASGLYVIRLIHNETTLHARWHETKYSSHPPSSRQDLRDLLQTAIDLDAEYQSWESTIPRSWRYQMERNTPEARNTYETKWRDLILGSRGAPGEIHSYCSLRRCWIWMFYRTSRMFLLRDLLEILNWMFRLPDLGTTDANNSLLGGNQDGNHQSFNDPTAIPKKSSTTLDTLSLSIHHAFATTHLANLIEKASSAVQGSFTVPVYGKSADDVMGMRGYISLWSLGIMDAILQAGLVPDSGAPPSPPSTTNTSPQPMAPSAFSQSHNQPAPSSVFTMPTQNIHPLYHNPTTAMPNPHDFSQLPPARTTPSRSPLASGSTTTVDPKPLRRHPYDINAPHPFDLPTNLPTLDFSITKPSSIDVAARRSWLHRMLCYLATDLGIKKGFAVVTIEGYLESSKTDVDRLLGR